MANNLFDELQWRGVVYDATPDAAQLLTQERVTGYIGFDPTAASLHVGSLLPVMVLARMQHFGHTPIAVVGGATGLIGDPSGKANERSLLSAEQVQHNLAGIRNQLARFLDFGDGDTATGSSAVIVDNAEWFRNMSVLDFLRDIGKHFPVAQMLARESVKKRMAAEEGISFTEFSYQLLQAYDFLVLNERYGCSLQMGGSDQWGNITAGIDLIRRVTGRRAAGLVFPLITNSNGAKFGKTEAGTVWLDANLTSPFRFYQFLLNTDDRDVVRYLKFFTWLTRVEIEELAQVTAATPERREAQQVLAREVTRMVHGAAALAKAEQATAALFGGDLSGLDATTVSEIFSDVPSTLLSQARLANGLALTELLAACGLAASRGEARRLVEAGGVYLNNRRVAGPGRLLTRDDAIAGDVFVLRRGRRDHHLVQIVAERPDSHAKEGAYVDDQVAR